MRNLAVVVLVVVGAVLLVVAALLIYVPAGIATAGFACVVSAYVARYLEVQSEST